MSKYEVFSGPQFPVFGLNTGKYGPEKFPYLDILHGDSERRWDWDFFHQREWVHIAGLNQTDKTMINFF